MKSCALSLSLSLSRSLSLSLSLRRSLVCAPPPSSAPPRSRRFSQFILQQLEVDGVHSFARLSTDTIAQFAQRASAVLNPEVTTKVHEVAKQQFG